MASSGRLLLAAAALCAAQDGVASERRGVTIGATVVASSQCRMEAASGPQCLGKGAPPKVVAVSAAPAPSAAFEGQFVMKVSAAGASLDSRKTLAPHFERVVLTIAP
jgi:hypothetical protein